MKAVLRVESEAHALCRVVRTTPAEASRLLSRTGHFEWRMQRYPVSRGVEEAERLLQDAIALRSWASSRFAASLLQPFAAATRVLAKAIQRYAEQLRREAAMARLGGGSIVEWTTGDASEIGRFFPAR